MAKKSAPVASFPSIGKKAPSFTAAGSNGKKVKLSDFSGKVLVLYFYPKDNTAGCTQEACSFRDAYDQFREAGVEVVGVSADSLESHAKFISKHDLPFTLLADTNHKMAEAYGTWRQKQMSGRKFMGVVRITFIIAPDGTLAHVFEKVTPAQHAKQILAWIRSNLKR